MGIAPTTRTMCKLMFGVFAILQLTSAMHTSRARYARGNMNLRQQFGEAFRKHIYGENLTAKQRMLKSMVGCRNPDPWGGKCNMHETSTTADVKKAISDDKWSKFYCRSCEDKARSTTKQDLALLD